MVLIRNLHCFLNSWNGVFSSLFWVLWINSLAAIKDIHRGLICCRSLPRKGKDNVTTIAAQVEEKYVPGRLLGNRARILFLTHEETQENTQTTQPEPGARHGIKSREMDVAAALHHVLFIPAYDGLDLAVKAYYLDIGSVFCDVWCLNSNCIVHCVLWNITRPPKPWRRHITRISNSEDACCVAHEHLTVSACPETQVRCSGADRGKRKDLRIKR